MATAGDVVTRALRLSNVIALGESVPSEMMSEGLTTLNRMVSSWAMDGADTGHVTVAQTDNILLADEELYGLELLLAELLAAEHGGMLNPILLAEAKKQKKRILARRLEFDDDLKPNRALWPEYFRHRVGAYDIDKG